MVVKSADHGNDVVVLLFCSFFFLKRTIFRESSMLIARPRKKKLQIEAPPSHFKGLHSDDDRIVSHDAPRSMLYYHCVRDISSVIFNTRNEHGNAPCGWFPNMFRFSSFCFSEYKVSLYSLSFRGKFQRHFERF